MTINILDIHSNGENRGELVTATANELHGEVVSAVWYRNVESKEQLFAHLGAEAQKRLAQINEQEAILLELMS